LYQGATLADDRRIGLGLPLAIVGVYELAHQAREACERVEAYTAARQAAEARGRPLLNVGCPAKWGRWKYPCGDVCLDISAERLAFCKSAQPTYGDVRSIPFPDDYFGAALCAHVLEHLPTVADARRALAELQRVTDGPVFVVIPSRASLAAQLNPEHHLWVDRLPDGSLAFVQR
jgi:hypothetical protein